MKQRLLFPTFIFCLLISYSGYSQYKIDEQRHFSYEDGIPVEEHESTLQYTYGNEGSKETSLLTLAMPDSESIMRIDKQYNANNLIISSVMYFWDGAEMLWKDISKTDYEYDGTNNLITETIQGNTFGTMPYTNSSRRQYTYSGANISTITNQNWNATTQVWVNSDRELFEYSGSDITLFTEQNWENGAWVNEEQTETTYDSTRNASQTMISLWNSGIADWEPDQRINYTYSANLMTEATGYDFIGGSWVWDYRTQLTYENGLLTVMVYQERNGETWENVDRMLYTYDSDDNNTILIIESWDNMLMDWAPESKVENDYSLVTPFVLGSESFDIENFKIYPNPASNVIHISSLQSIEKIELYDVLGKKVRSSSNVNQLNVESLKSGMYIMRIYNKSSSVTKKIGIK